MIENKRAEEELDHTLRFVEPLLRVLGVWPLTSTSVYSKLLQRSVIVLVLSLQLFLLGPAVLYIILIRNDGKTTLKLMLPVLNSISQTLKYSILLYRSNEFKIVLKEIREDWLSVTEENRKIFRDESKKGHAITLAIIVTMYSSGLGYRVAFPLLKGRISLPDNTTIRLLPTPGYFIFNEQLTPNYEIIFTLQVLAGCGIYTIFCGGIGILLILCLHACGLLRILVKKLIDFTAEEEVDELVVQKKLVDIVEYQMKIKRCTEYCALGVSCLDFRFINNIESITQYVCFFEVCINTILLCIVGYYIVMEWKDSNITAVVVYIGLATTCALSTFTVCYIGQLLLDESNIVQRTCITLSWYHLPKRKVRSILMIIIRSNKSIKLTGGKVIDMSLATFSDIVKTTFGYLNMLRKVF